MPDAPAQLGFGMAPILEAAIKGTLVLAWPQPRLAIQTPDMLDLGLQKVSNGLMSHLMLIQDVYNCDRDTALEIVAQIKKDTTDVAALFPEMDKATGLPDPDPGPGGDEDSPDDSNDNSEGIEELEP